MSFRSSLIAATTRALHMTRTLRRHLTAAFVASILNQSRAMGCQTNRGAMKFRARGTKGAFGRHRDGLSRRWSRQSVRFLKLGHNLST